MLTHRQHGANTIWNIATSPSKEEILTLMKDLQIGDEYLEELSTPTPQPVCMDLQGTTYAVFHIPVLTNPKDTQSLDYTEAEIDVLIGKNSTTTILYTDPALLGINIEEISKHIHDHPTDLWWRVLASIYTKIHKDIDRMIVELKEVRDKVFTQKENIEHMSDMHRAYLAIDLAVSTHEDIIDSIRETAHTGHGNTTVSRPWSKVRGEYHRLTQKLEKLGAFIHELRHTQNSLISARQGTLTRTFTVLAFVFLPINFLAALFGMNVIQMPVVSHPQAFWILLGGFIGISFIMLLFFKIRKWL